MALKHDLIADFLDRSVERQSWYRKNANTVNGGVAGLAGAVAFLLAYVQTTGQWPGIEGLLVFLAPVLSALALKLTRNGIGEVQAAELKRKAAMEERRETPSSRSTAPGPAPTEAPATTSSGLPVYHGPSTRTEA